MSTISSTSSLHKALGNCSNMPSVKVENEYGNDNEVDPKLLYHQLLKSARNSNSSRPVPTLYPWHCKLAFIELLDLAIKKQQKNKAIQTQNKARTVNPVEIRLFTGTLTEHIYDVELQHQLYNFIKLGGKLLVIVWNESNSIILANSFAQQFLNDENVQIRFSQTTEGQNELNHFFLVDDFAFRLEDIHPYYPRDVFTDFHPMISAKVNFNDKKQGLVLKRLFDSVWIYLEDEVFNPNLALSNGYLL